jgi:hypothetical protein
MAHMVRGEVPGAWKSLFTFSQLVNARAFYSVSPVRTGLWRLILDF